MGREHMPLAGRLTDGATVGISLSPGPRAPWSPLGLFHAMLEVRAETYIRPRFPSARLSGALADRLAAATAAREAAEAEIRAISERGRAENWPSERIERYSRPQREVPDGVNGQPGAIAREASAEHALDALPALSPSRPGIGSTSPSPRLPPSWACSSCCFTGLCWPRPGATRNRRPRPVLEEEPPADPRGFC